MNNPGSSPINYFICYFQHAEFKFTMKIKILKPKKALNKAFLKVKPHREEIEIFKNQLTTLIDRINEAESEEFHKNLVTHFLKRTYYDPHYFINTKGKNDLVIHTGKNAKSPVGVIIETKSPVNRYEMITRDQLNRKALHELILYYLRERILHKNLEIKHLIITNIYEWFLFDATLFEQLFAQNKTLVRQFRDFEDKRLSGQSTDFFYRDITAPFIENIKSEIEVTHFDFRKFQTILRNSDKKDDHKLIALYKLLSPEHLLKLPFANDSNSLDKGFYGELLHILGLHEKKAGGKKLIERYPEKDRAAGSFIENTIFKLEGHDVLRFVRNPRQYGDSREERLFNMALELCIIWINRILFLKLLEAQLLSYHQRDAEYAFLNLKKIHDFDELDALFFQVLARHPEDRTAMVQKKFDRVPYLNSSLFEPERAEHSGIFIGNLDDDKTLPIYSSTVLKDSHGKRLKGELTPLEYLFRFLESYDFSSEGSEEIQEENKTLINASVLGLIFEKINGYKDGSFFTPGFITMYMSRETIRKAVIQKFNEVKNWNCTTISDLYNQIDDIQEANEIVNSVKICDPAVGSGHFLVSSLNEMIAVKNDLRILQDRQGRRLKEYHVEVQNDELIITDEDGDLFEYHPRHRESQRVQEALFHEKQTIIENCLFGVDINSNSVKICRLRLWIELLKNAYYYEKPGMNGKQYLQTLPNIDINIKTGNSLISRFALDSDLREALRKSKWNIDSYRIAVSTYRRARSREEKQEMEELIDTIKSDFRSEISRNDPKVRRLQRLSGELFQMTSQGQLFSMEGKEKKAWEKKVKDLTKKVDRLEAEIQEIENNKIYENAFEWRFEFPEVLDDDGNYVGFDAVIANPPYIRQEEIKEIKPYLQKNFHLYSGTADLYIYFIELGFRIIKNEGSFIFIMPNKFMQAGYGAPVRKFLSNQQIHKIIDFGDFQVFDEATTYPCILSASKIKNYKEIETVKISDNSFRIDFPDYISNHINPISPESLSEETWIISNPVELRILKKAFEQGTKLENYIEIESKRGIITGFTKAFLVTEDQRKNIIFEDPNSEELLKPVLRGRDIQKWYSETDNLWLITTFPALQIDIENYPGIKNHLLSFGKERLEQSGKKGSRKKTSHKWFETQDTIAYWKDFENPKIMFQKFQVKPCFILDENGFLCNDSMWIIPGKDKVLLGILNSKMGWWLISKYCTAIRNGYQLIWKYFREIPIVHGNEKQREAMESKVDKILSLKKNDVDADTSDLESQIDQLVYELYDLTEEEIEIVEQSS